MIRKNNSDKKAYVKPEINVVEIEAADIIATSKLGFGDDEDDGYAI